MSLVKNKKIGYEYEIIKTWKGGLSLLGSEVKSLKKGQGSLNGAYCILRGGSLFIKKMCVPPYQEKNAPANYDEYRERQVLLTKKEIREIGIEESQRHLTFIPISIYNDGRHLKVEIALVRKLKKHDKRELLKKRDSDREISSVK